MVYPNFSVDRCAIQGEWSALHFVEDNQKSQSKKYDWKSAEFLLFFGKNQFWILILCLVLSL